MSAKEAGITIQVLSSYPDFEPIAAKLIPTLVKQLQSGNKILAEVGHTSILGILTQIPSTKIQNCLCTEFGNSKSPQVHCKMSIYLFYMMTSQIDIMEDATAETFLKLAITSPSPEARQTGRKGFLIWKEFNNFSAQNLFQRFDYNAQKAISDDQLTNSVFVMSDQSNLNAVPQKSK